MPVDWASLVVIVSAFVLPTLLSRVVDRWWTAREYAQQQAAQQEGQIFPIPPMLRSPTLFAMFAASAVSLIMFIAGLNGPRTGITMEAGVGFLLLFFPLIAGGALFLLSHTGVVVLTPEGVSVRRPGRDRFLRYEDVTRIESRRNPFTAALLIHGTGRPLKISRTIENWPRFYELLLQRVRPAVRQATLTQPAIPPLAAPCHCERSEAIPNQANRDRVYALAVSRRMWGLYAAGTVLLVLIYLGIALLPVWAGLAGDAFSPLTTEFCLVAAFFFLLTSALFLPALFVAYRGFTSRVGPNKIERPIAWEFSRGKIRYRFPQDDWQERPAHDLERMRVEPLRFTVKARVDGANVAHQATAYMIILEFVDGKRMVIDQERVMQFGHTLERLHVMLKELYELD